MIANEVTKLTVQGFLNDYRTCAFLTDFINHVSDILFVYQVYGRQYMNKRTGIDGSKILETRS